MDTSKANRPESYIFTYETSDKQDLLVTNIYSKNTNNSDIMWVTLSITNQFLNIELNIRSIVVVMLQ